MKTKKVVCRWPVTDEHPSKSPHSVFACPEPRCEKQAGHSGDHEGTFGIQELEKVERPN